MDKTQFFAIGEMLNDDKLRRQIAITLNEKFFYDQIIINIVKSLKLNEFTFEKLYIDHGKETVIKAIEICNAYTRKTLNL